MDSAGSVFDTFQNKCFENITNESLKGYCQPTREALESSWKFVAMAGDWTGSAVTSVGTTWMWGWTKSGEYGNPFIQGIWLALSLALAYNVKNMVFGKTRDVVVISKPHEHS